MAPVSEWRADESPVASANSSPRSDTRKPEPFDGGPGRPKTRLTGPGMPIPASRRPENASTDFCGGGINCTFADNAAGTADGGGAIYHVVDSDDRTSTANNCIMWKNTGSGDHSHEADQIVVTDNTGDAPMDVLNTCIEDWDSMGQFPDVTNTGQDPLFGDMANDDYSLLSTSCGMQSCSSSAIDRGEDGNTPCGDCSCGDLNGDNRCVNLDNRSDENDMGAIETQS